MEKEGFVYIWYDRKRKMYYIGCHWGTIDDGYICSSKRMHHAKARRPQDFKRRIIQRRIDRERLLEEEFKWLSQIKEEELGVRYYNLNKHYHGHWSNDPNSRLTIGQKISKANVGRKYPNRNPPPSFSETHREKIRERMIGNKYTSGHKLSDEHKQKLRNKLRGKVVSEETKQKLREARARQVVSEETKQKISNTQKGRKLSSETRRKMSESQKVRRASAKI